MSRQAFSNFDISIIILLVTLVCGFLIYMILRLLEIFTTSGELKKEKRMMDIEVLKMEKELIKKAQVKKKKADEESQEGEDKKETSEESPPMGEDTEKQDQKGESSDDEEGDSFADIDEENIVQF